MKLSSFKYFPYTLKFNSEYTTSKKSHHKRNIFLLQLTSDSGETYFGEAAPLTDYGSESFEEVENELNRLTSIKRFEYNDSLSEIFQCVNQYSSLPTVQFALEQIFIRHLFQIQNSLLSELPINNSVFVNALIDISSKEDSKNRIKELARAGYRTIKLKANKNNFEDLYDIISWTESEIEENIKFRIDPNCSWNITETLKQLERLETHKIEYLEQPVKSTEDLIHLAERSPIPIAADESIRFTIDAELLSNESKVKFLILKPMLLGGLGKVKETESIVNGKDIKLIISSALESNIGRRHLSLITAMQNNKLAHGLGTAGLFSNNLTGDIFPIINGQLNFSLEKYFSEMVVKL